MDLLSILADVQSVAAYMDTGYPSHSIRLPGVPELNGVVPSTADQLVRRFWIETRTENSGFMTVHNFQRVAGTKECF